RRLKAPRRSACPSSSRATSSSPEDYSKSHPRYVTWPTVFPLEPRAGAYSLCAYIRRQGMRSPFFASELVRYREAPAQVMTNLQRLSLSSPIVISDARPLLTDDQRLYQGRGAFVEAFRIPMHSLHDRESTRECHDDLRCLSGGQRQFSFRRW